MPDARSSATVEPSASGTHVEALREVIVKPTAARVIPQVAEERRP